jgi:hypothetical protein
MLPVFFTIDTEVYPLLPDWKETDLRGDIARDIDGHTDCGDVGLEYQLRVLREYNIPSICFVEPLFTSAVGLDPLRRIVNLIKRYGHEVQLHLHSEWLKHVPKSIWNGDSHLYISDYPEDQQAQLVALALRNLRAAGGEDISAFRAGGYIANSATLRALEQNGIFIDSSYNFCHLHEEFRRTSSPLLQSTQIGNVTEIPVSWFSDWPGHYRHAQITACSLPEMKHALLQAARARLDSFVIVSHSFEMLMDRRTRIHRPQPDWTTIRRFHGLCEFLAANRDLFQVCTFRNLPGCISAQRPSQVILKSNVMRTARRFAEQGFRRIRNRVVR